MIEGVTFALWRNWFHVAVIRLPVDVEVRQLFDGSGWPETIVQGLKVDSDVGYPAMGMLGVRFREGNEIFKMPCSAFDREYASYAVKKNIVGEDYVAIDLKTPKFQLPIHHPKGVPFTCELLVEPRFWMHVRGNPTITITFMGLQING